MTSSIGDKASLTESDTSEVSAKTGVLHAEARKRRALLRMSLSENKYLTISIMSLQFRPAEGPLPLKPHVDHCKKGT